jgi:single-strand selective monofunctional uracil DNA glycosylase
MPLKEITDRLVKDLAGLHFSDPVFMVYNPLEYARKAYDRYLDRYAYPPKEIVLLGMNPGPWGMAQTGVPFGEVSIVRDWLGIQAEITPPATMHPKRPVLGFSCQRSEVSGKRLWGWARESFGEPERFFRRFFVANYCPLLFMEESGRNRTPNNLKASERKALQQVCDDALRRSIKVLRPRFVVGIGRFAAQRAREALSGTAVEVGEILHPSPANPKANRDWRGQAASQFAAMGITIP